MPHPEIGDGVDKQFPASDEKRRRGSLHSVSNSWTALLYSWRICGKWASLASWRR